MNLDDLKKEIEAQWACVNEAGKINSYFCLLGYDYPNFSVHMDVSSRQLANMFLCVSSDSRVLRNAILATADVIRALRKGVDE